MEQQHDYIRDISEIRSMMERSSKFTSLPGFAAIMAGVYALACAVAAYTVFRFNPDTLLMSETQYMDSIMKLTASVNRNCGPPLSSMNLCPSNSMMAVKAGPLGS